MNSIKENLDKINEHIEKACLKAGRKPEEVRLMAISKTYPLEEIEEAYAAGQRLFGESRVQEAAGKFDGFHGDAELHLVGHLQSNKAKTAATLFSCVQSVDRIKTAAELDKRCAAAGRTMDILIEYNTSGEESKSGILSEDELYRTVDGISGLDCIRLKGLMTVGPFTVVEKDIRSSFRLLRELYGRIEQRYPELEMDTLSMGMSGDYHYAVEEGATLVRIGTAVFGPRSYA